MAYVSTKLGPVPLLYLVILDGNQHIDIAIESKSKPQVLRYFTCFDEGPALLTRLVMRKKDEETKPAIIERASDVQHTISRHRLKLEITSRLKESSREQFQCPSTTILRAPSQSSDIMSITWGVICESQNAQHGAASSSPDPVKQNIQFSLFQSESEILKQA